MGIGVLGPLTIDGSEATINRRDRAVLQALAASRGSVLSADRLADAVWGDQPPASWTKNIQQCVMRLRRVLGEDAITTHPQGYRLAVDGDDLDAGRFERLVDRARDLLALGEVDRARFALDDALSLWRGTALPDLVDWDTGQIEAERLTGLRLDAEELRLDCALRDGEHAEVLPELAASVKEQPLRERRWALLALAQYRCGRQAEALQTLRQVRGVLARELGLDPGPELVALETAILQQDPALLVEAKHREGSDRCPYQGLVPYDVDDSEAFFGREADVAVCLRRLDQTGAVVVVGPSGSGKSSLVRAGVAAALQEGGRKVHVVTPGAQPMAALAAVRPSDVVVVDQCEEAVTLCADLEERAAFFDALADHDGLVVALRADRMGAVAEHPRFARVVERSLHLLNPMTPTELRTAIETPADQAGLLLEPGLVDLLLRDVEGEPGALPLLSHALRETWMQREGRTLTVEGYRATGGIRGAVARTADEVWSGLDADQQHATRDLLLRLVTTGGEGEPVRRRVPRRLIVTGRSDEQVVERLVAARLVTSDEGSLQVAHEALARAWPRLQDWLAEDAQGQQVRHHLSAAADAWDALGRPDSELYRGVRLAQAKDWREQSHPSLTPVEHAFFEASERQVDAELQAAQHQAEREAAAGRRTRRLAAGLAVVLAMALVSAGLATYFQREAEDRADEATAASVQAEANRLAQLSGTVGGLDTSLLLAVEAFATADTPATRDGLLATLLEHRRAEQVLPLTGNVTASALSDDGRILYVGLRDQVVSWEVGSSAPPEKVIDIPLNARVFGASSDGLFAVDDPFHPPRVIVRDATGEAVRDLRFEEQVGGQPWDAELTSDGRLLRLFVGEFVRESPAGVELRGVVRTVEVATGRELDRRALFEPREPAWLDGSFAADGSALVAWQQLPGLPAKLFRFRDREPVRLRSVLPAGVEPLRYWPLPDGAAQARSDGSIALFDAHGTQVQVLEAHQSEVRAVAVSTDGTWAASGDTTGRISLWDVDADAGQWTVREVLSGHDGSVQALQIPPSGDALISAADDGSLISWDTSPSAGFGSSFGSGLAGRWVSNRPATVIPGELVVAPTRPQPPRSLEAGRYEDQGFQDEVWATFLDPRSGEVVDQVPIGPALGQVYGSSVSVSPSGSHVAVTHGFGTVVLDTGTREQVARIDLPSLDNFAEAEAVWDTAWTPDGSRLVIAADGGIERGDDGGLVLVDTDTWEVERRLSPGSGASLPLPIPGELAEGAVLPQRPGAAPQVMEFSPDGAVLAFGAATGPGPDDPAPQVVVVDGTTFELQYVVPLAAGAYPFDLSFSPDGSMLAVVGDGGTLTVLDAESWTPLHDPVEVHAGYARQVEWLADGETVVTSGSDGSVTLYDVARDLVRVDQVPGSSDGRPGRTHLFPSLTDELVAITESGPGRRYPMDVPSWIERACAVAGRDLTEAEWDRYLPTREYDPACADR